MSSNLSFEKNNKSMAGKVITGAVVVVVIVAGIIGLSKGFSKKSSETNLKSSASSNTSQSQSVEQPVKVVVDYGDLQKTETEMPANGEMTAFSALEEAAKKDGVEVITTKYDFGIMVNSIGAYKGGEDGKFWLYYVNSKVPEVGADQYKVKAGDVVEWKFEKQ